MKKIVAINLGWEQETLLDLICKREIEIYGVHSSQNYYRIPNYKDVLITDLRDLEKISRFADSVSPDAVISDQCDYSNFAQALISEKFKLPGPSVAEAHIGCNKFLQRNMCKKENIPYPEFVLCFSVNDVIKFAENVGFPIILKPIDNRGSYGVNRVDCFQECQVAYYDSLINSPSRYVLAEKFIEGQNLTVDGYVFKGLGPIPLAVGSRKKMQHKKSIIDGEHLYPAEIPDSVYLVIQKTFQDIARKLGFSFGFLHAEFILTNHGEVFLTEIANRGGGIGISEILVPNVSGIDINNIYLNDCLGEMYDFPDLSKIQKNPTMIRLFDFSQSDVSVVKEISGVEEVERDPHVLKVKLLISPGDTIKRIQGGGDRHGLIILSGESKNSLRSEMTRLLKSINVK